MLIFTLCVQPRSHQSAEHTAQAPERRKWRHGTTDVWSLWLSFSFAWSLVRARRACSKGPFKIGKCHFYCENSIKLTGHLLCCIFVHDMPRKIAKCHRKWLDSVISILREPCTISVHHDRQKNDTLSIYVDLNQQKSKKIAYILHFIHTNCLLPPFSGVQFTVQSRATVVGLNVRNLHKVVICKFTTQQSSTLRKNIENLNLKIAINK